MITYTPLSLSLFCGQSIPLVYIYTGHPDNVAPAIYGGIQIGMHTGERWTSERVNTPQGIQLVLFIPDFIGKTSDARAVLEVRCTYVTYILKNVSYTTMTDLTFLAPF